MKYPKNLEYVKASQDASDNLDMSTKATAEELREAFVDEWGVKYSKDGRKLLKAPYKLNGAYSINEGVRIICNWAFFNCRSLSSLVIPDSVASIGNKAFSVCTSLTSLVIPDGVVCINGNPFAKWDGKLECLSPNFIYEDEVLFNKDKSKIISCRVQAIRSYIIPSSVTSIGDSAFEGCFSLRNIAIPSSVTSIGKSAFSGCTYLSSLVIPDSVVTIGTHAFCGCESLTHLVIPSSVKSIGEGAFYGCSSLDSIFIPNGLINIGKYAFDRCKFPQEIREQLTARFGKFIFK